MIAIVVVVAVVVVVLTAKAHVNIVPRGTLGNENHKETIKKID